jgi:hypothetical protein
MIREICQLIDERFGGQVVRPAVVTLTVARKSSERCRYDP